MFRLLFAAVTLMALTATNTHADKIYKWTDEKGTTHYSSQPPADKLAETLDIRRRESADAVDGRQINSNDTTAVPPRASKKDPARCQDARDTYEKLTDEGEMRVRDAETGEYRQVKDDELAQWLEWVESDIREYCP